MRDAVMLGWAPKILLKLKTRVLNESHVLLNFLMLDP